MPPDWARLLTGVERSGAASTVVMAASAPASTHTNVDTFRVLRPASRLASGLAAVAVMAIPQIDRFRNHASAAPTSGIATSATTCGPWTVMLLPSCQVLLTGVGKAAPNPSTLGTLITSTVTSCATPMVATNRVMRADSKSLRTTVISIAHASSADAATPTARAGTYGQFQSMTIFATSTAARDPIAP